MQLFQRSAQMALTTVATVAVTFSMSGCVGTSESRKIPEPTSAFTGEVPAFEGPYAEEFESFYRETDSDFVRSVLQDGKISDAEYAEMQTQFSSCLEDQGITVKGFAPDGSITTSVAPNGGDTNALVQQCSKAAGEDSIGALQSFMAVNPDNLDMNAIVVDCLVQAGVVPDDYSVEEFARDSEQKFGDPETTSPELQEALGECSSDPLGMLD